MLSKRQYTVLSFIHQFNSEYGFAPSLREIGTAAGISSTSVVKYNIERLVKLGYLVAMPAKSRAFSLTSAAYERLGVSEAQPDTAPLLAEIRKLKAENAHLRQEHKTQMAGLRREYTHLLQELKQLRQEAELYPV